MVARKKNPTKVMLIITIVLVLAVIAVVLFKKDKIVLEDETGNQYTGVSGKLLNTSTTEAEA